MRSSLFKKIIIALQFSSCTQPLVAELPEGLAAREEPADSTVDASDATASAMPPVQLATYSRTQLALRNQMK